MFTSSTPNQDQNTKLGTSATQKIMDDTKEGFTRVKDHMDDAGREARRSAHEVKGDLNEWAHDAGQSVRTMLDDAGSEFSSFTHRAERQIRDKPVQSALMALGVGFVAGLLARR